MGTVTVTSQGQITLPAQVRRLLDIHTSDKLDVTYDEREGTITLRRRRSLEELNDLAARYVRPDVPPLTDPSGYYRERARG